jgi:hypothetical protein
MGFVGILINVSEGLAIFCSDKDAAESQFNSESRQCESPKDRGQDGCSVSFVYQLSR